MDFALSPRAEELREQLEQFVREHALPAEAVYHEQLAASGDPHSHPQIIEDLKAEARRRGLWNLFLPHDPRR
ncbi:MAG TPA: acyl-CoA dehydrogenase, partial [Acidimicrobiia bacterium]|nr:acyl-CoA dehydrogenase [Acidimicrobiia bacterium]